MRNRQGRESLKVLVIGEDSRSFLSVIRSLGNAGYDVHVVCYDRTSIALKSKYISQCFYYNYEAYTQKEWITNVLAIIDRFRYDLIIPCDERAIYPLWVERRSIPPKTKLAICNQDALHILFDKWKTKQVALKLGVSVARGELVDLTNTNYEQLSARFGDKFVLKPLQSFEISTLNKRNKVVSVKSNQDYIDFIKANASSTNFLVEEYFRGTGEGLSVFCSSGTVKSAFSYKRLAEPSSGGGSSYRESTPLDPELLKATQAICKETKLTGVAMFEFRRNVETGEWILIEVNARFWGGLPLAISSGVDFPKVYADFLCFDKEPQSINYNYRIGVRSRSLTSDLYEIKREFDINCQSLGKKVSSKILIYRLLNIAKVIAPTENIDTLRINDLRPFASEVKEILNIALGRFTKKNRVNSVYRRWRTKKKLNHLFSSNPNRRIIFLCYGNIMRSPFAEKIALNFPLSDSSTLDIDSFGFHNKESRSSPEIARNAALLLNCDLSKHSSKSLMQLDISHDDIIIYFDDKNKGILEKNYDINNAFCAADLLNNQYPSLTEIIDPYGGDISVVKDCYEKISNSVGNLSTIYKEALK